MAWQGYFAYDGNEFINVARTETYMREAGLYWFKPAFNNEALGYMLGDALHYSTPFLDDAPWVDPNNPDSLQFYGYYPLDVNGIEDSTRTSTVVESLSDGGVPGRLRNTTRTIVFNGLILAGTEAAAAYGMRWLKQTLLGNACGTSTASACNGADLCYLDSEPSMALPDSEDQTFQHVGTSVQNPVLCLIPYQRSLRKVLFNSGPTIAAKGQIRDGGQAWTVQFTAVAGDPWEFSAEVPVIEGFLDPAIAVPWSGGVIPDGGVVDLTGFVFPDSLCAVPTYSAVYDPLCPGVIPPPGPPSIPLGCYVAPKTWHRRQITIPEQYVPLWGEVVPKVSIHARGTDIRNLRLRFYADPFQIGDITDDPCSYCGDIVVSYVPQDHTLVLDGAEQAVYVLSAGGTRRRADSLVFSTDGTPFDWPSLSCGFGYVVTFDLPDSTTKPVIDLSLFARAV